MRPEMLVCDQISRMVGAPLDEEGIHRFLRGLAQVLEAQPISMYGPGLRFRWVVDDRTIEVEAQRARGDWPFELSVRGMDTEYAIDIEEYRTFKWADPADYPFYWSVDICQIPGAWVFYPGAYPVGTWDSFSDLIAPTLDELPADIAMTPPEWRRPFRWRMTAPQLGDVFFTALPEGVEVMVESTGEALLVPRSILERWSGSHPVGMGMAIAGLAHGAPFMSVGFAFCERDEAHHFYAEAPIGPEWEREGISADDFDEGEKAWEPLSVGELRRLIARPPVEQEEEPIEIRRAPFRAGLGAPEVLMIVGDIRRGRKPARVFKKHGARRARGGDGPVFEADGWSASPKRDDGWRVNLVEPPAARVRFDDREVVEYARGIGGGRSRSATARHSGARRARLERSCSCSRSMGSVCGSTRATPASRWRSASSSPWLNTSTGRPNRSGAGPRSECPHPGPRPREQRHAPPAPRMSSGR